MVSVPEVVLMTRITPVCVSVTLPPSMIVEAAPFVLMSVRGEVIVMFDSW